MAVAGTLFGIGHGFTFPILFGIVVTRARESDRGSAMAILTGMFDVGVVLGGPLFGAIIAGFGFTAAFGTAAAVVRRGALRVRDLGRAGGTRPGARRVECASSGGAMSDDGYVFPVDLTSIMLFASAIGETNPIYYDEAYAAQTPLGKVIAPPSFASAGAHWDPDYFLKGVRKIPPPEAPARGPGVRHRGGGGGGGGEEAASRGCCTASSASSTTSPCRRACGSR